MKDIDYDKMFLLEKLYTKYRNGDFITDEELKEGLKRMRNARNMLLEFGSEFYIAYREAERVLQGLEQMQRARKEK
jgi:hypothetical protein